MKCLVPLSLFLLLLTGNAKVQAGEKNYAIFPTGDGDPDAITCRPPQALRDSRLHGPEVCRKNWVWAQYRHDGMDVAQDGIHDVPISDKSGITCTAVALPNGASGPLRMNMKCLDLAPDAARPVMLHGQNGIRCTTGMNCS